MSLFNNIFRNFRRITSNDKYFPEIDGIRFLAIIIVVLFHIHGYFMEKAGGTFVDSPDQYEWLNELFRSGDRGVRLFFVLSGYILCLPFAYHYLKQGKKIELKKYYLRRVTRLEPPYMLTMVGLFVLNIAMHTYPTAFLFKSLLASLTYTHNIIFQHVPYLTVIAWSLEIEIQFYLIAPMLFKLLKLPALLRRSILIAGIILFVTLQHFYEPPFISIYNHIQFFLAGILLADFSVSGFAEDQLKGSWAIFGAILMLALIFILPVEFQLLSAILFPFIIGTLFYIVMKNPSVKKAFSYKYIPIIGGMCYSIYLVHYTIISAMGRLTLKFRLTEYYLVNLGVQIVILSLLILILSSIFYYFIERPFMSKKWLDMLLKKKKTTDADQTV